MDKEQKRHLSRIKESFSEIVEAKYEKGAREHGGHLWDNPCLLDEAIDEVIDLYVYLITLREKVKR